MNVEDPSVPRLPPAGHELPSSDGIPMETARHAAQMHLLLDSLCDAWRDRRDFYAGGDMFVYYSEPQAREAQRTGTTRFRGPDVFVVLDSHWRERESWVAWEEDGKLPDVIIEITSKTTAHIDRGPKKDLYGKQWRTGAYFVYDPFTHELEGYLLDPFARTYRPVEALPSGDLPVPSMGLALGVRDLPCLREPGPSLRWIDAEGRAVPTAAERLEGERAHAETQRAHAESELSRTESELARLAAELERERTERERLEARLRELEAKLR